MEVQPIECNKIDVPKVSNELRTFSKEFAYKLADSVKCEGLYNPIVARPNPAAPGRYILVQGKHRLYAVKNVLKEQFIAATVAEDMDDTDAEMAMICENIWRNPLTKTQLALGIKKWWEHFQTKNPDRAVRGKAGCDAAAKAKRDKREALEGQANDTQESAEQGDSAAEASREAGFAATVAAATGQSERSVERSIKLAKTFDADQLESFGQMSVTQTDMLTVAKIKDKAKRDEVVNLIASGMEPGDAIKEVMKEAAPVRDNGSGKATAEAKAAAKAEKAPEMSDEEWYTTYCGEKAAMLGDTTRFKADALLYRKVTDARHAFRVKIKGALKATAEAGTKGSFWSLLNRVVSISHPGSWLICDGCKGTGKVEDGEKCKKCYGACYLLKTEEYL